MFFATYASNLGGGGGGGGGSPTVPGGIDESVQYNDSGTFGGTNSFRFNKSNTSPALLLGDSVAFPSNTPHLWFDAPVGTIAQGNTGAGAGCFITLGFGYMYVGTNASYTLYDGSSGSALFSGNITSSSDGAAQDIGIMFNGALVRFRDLAVSGAISSGYQLNTTATSGGSDTVIDHVSSYILSPSGALATFTLTMPGAPKDGLELRLASPVNGATSLTLSANAGQTLYGAITSLTAGQFATYKYLAGSASWVRVG